MAFAALHLLSASAVEVVLAASGLEAQSFLTSLLLAVVAELDDEPPPPILPVNRYRKKPQKLGASYVSVTAIPSIGVGGGGGSSEKALLDIKLNKTIVVKAKYLIVFIITFPVKIFMLNIKPHNIDSRGGGGVVKCLL